MKRQNLPVILSVMLVMFLLFAYLFKDNLNNLISEKMQVSMNPGIPLAETEKIDSLFNHFKNGKTYSYTLIEFGSTGCSVCKQMETVLEEIKQCCSDKVEVVFINTTFPENRTLVGHFGIPAIPMQVLLDKTGKELFRNYGYISTDDLKKKMNR